MEDPVFVTGGNGFAGRHLVAHLGAEQTESVAPSRQELDLRDFEATRHWIAATRPSAVCHLAAHSSPTRAWDRPRETILENIEMTHNLLEAVRLDAPAATVVIAGSAQSYGVPKGLPISEEMPLEPVNPYAVSKASCELLAGQYEAAFGIRLVRMRPFNHAGPGQSSDYICGTLAQQIAEAESTQATNCTLRTGNPAVRRDFTDVRDVARAYAVAAKGSLSGTFNVCSGVATSIQELVAIISRYTELEVKHEVEPKRVRSEEVTEIVGSHAKLKSACGWQPKISLDQTLADTLQWWRKHNSEI